MRLLLYLAVCISNVSSFIMIRPFYKIVGSNTRRSLRLSEAPSSPNKIAIIGGGLAGLSTLYHLIDKSSVAITVFDNSQVGTGGASSVAGGLLHPLSPRGKLVHWGLDELKASNRLIEAACQAVPDVNVVLSDEIIRLALTKQHVEQLQSTASEAQLSMLCEWLNHDALRQHLGKDLVGTSVLGGLRMHNGCRVIHVPSYLQALWNACKIRALETKSQATWIVLEHSGITSSLLEGFDAVVLAAGAGLFDRILKANDFPIQLVRGQSVELEQNSSKGYQSHLDHALLCGKYISPLPDQNRFLVGATHEFMAQAMSNDTVIAELRERSYEMAPCVWNDSRVHRVTSGVRVQTERGQYGRRPLVGRLPQSLHPNTWIFTGLSSRGILYHGLYGDYLSDAIVEGSEQSLLSRCSDILWWKHADCHMV